LRGASDRVRMGCTRTLVLSSAGLLALAIGCSYDPEERCDPDQELYGDALRCVCKLPKVWSPSGCVACPAGETPTELGCVCAEGQSRQPDGTCVALPVPGPSTSATTEIPDADVSCGVDASCIDAGGDL
jgi:hypothetical protein